MENRYLNPDLIDGAARLITDVLDHSEYSSLPSYGAVAEAEELWLSLKGDHHDDGEGNLVSWLLAKTSIDLSVIRRVITMYPLLSVGKILEDILIDHGDDGTAFERALALMTSPPSREELIEMLGLTEGFPRSQQVVALEMIRLAEYRPIPAWIIFEDVPEVVNEDDPILLDMVYGPRNLPDDNDPLDGRMLIFNSGQTWFNGFCEGCFGKIRRAEHAIRVPLVIGWEGCFCSFACMINSLVGKNKDDLVTMARILKICQQINKTGVLADPVDSEAPQAMAECDAVTMAFRK